MSDLIDRQVAIDELHGKDPSQIWDTADIEVWLNTLPSVPPQKICVAEVTVGIDDIKDYIDKTIEEIKTGEWLHDLLQDAIDAGIITETQASRLMDRIAEDNT